MSAYPTKVEISITSPYFGRLMCEKFIEANHDVKREAYLVGLALQKMHDEVLDCLDNQIPDEGPVWKEIHTLEEMGFFKAMQKLKENEDGNSKC